MKFRRLVLILIFAALIVGYFTKPTEEDFKKFIQPTISRTNMPPAIEYQDKFLYAKVIATFVDVQNSIQNDNRKIAPAIRKEYIGCFKNFWELNK